MAIKNSEELGSNLVIIAKRLLANKDLCKLLVYDDAKPLNHEDIKDPMSLLEKNIRIVPKINKNETTESRLALLFTDGAKNKENNEFKTLSLNVLVYVPLSSWIIEGDSLRPFSIMNEVEKSIKDKKIDGIGKLNYKSFELNILTDEMSCYLMTFELDVYD